MLDFAEVAVDRVSGRRGRTMTADAGKELYQVLIEVEPLAFHEAEQINSALRASGRIGAFDEGVKKTTEKTFADFQIALRMLADLADKASTTLISAGPDEINLSFRLEVSGEAGGPYVGKVSATGALGVGMVWKRGGEEAQSKGQAHAGDVGPMSGSILT